MKIRRSIRRMIAFIAILLFIIPAATQIPAEAKSKAKTDPEISRKTVKAEMNEKFSLKLKTSREVSYFGTDIIQYTDDSRTSYNYYYGATCEDKGEGKFTYSFPEGGSYTIIIYMVDGEGKFLNDRCDAEIENIGPTKRRFALLVGTSTELHFDRSEMIGLEIDTGFYYDYWYYNIGGVELSGNTVTGVKAGRQYLNVTYRTDKGEIRTETLTVDVTDPTYESFGQYLFAGHYYYPSVSGTSENSTVSLSSGDTGIVEANKEYFIARSAGTCELTINADGRIFTEKITVLDPRISDEVVLLKKKKSRKITVTGLPDDIKPEFVSADKKIALVSADGKIKAKKAGSTYITVNCGNLIRFTCSVTVTKGGVQTDAAKKAYSHIGSKYSQDYRMSEGYFDCSSLAWRSYKEAGKALAGETKYAPTAANLAKALEADGKAIAYEFTDPNELQPGDLIFYSSGTSDRYMSIDHVAIYYGANYSDYYGYGENTGAIVHAISPYVCLNNYSYYIPYRIVMICRP